MFTFIVCISAVAVLVIVVTAVFGFWGEK